MANGFASGLAGSRNVTQAGNEVLDVLEERNVQGLAFVGLSTTGGVIFAQEVADRVLPLLNMPRNPQTATQFAASAGVKGATAAGLGALAGRLSGMPLVAVAFAGIGALAGAGADLVNAIQRTGFLAEAPFTGSSGGSSQNSSGGSTSASSAAPSAEVRV